MVTGASGVGKSSARAAVAPVLSPQVECVELGDLLPVSTPTEMTRAWRQRAAEAAVSRAVELRASGEHLLLAGDPVAALEIIGAPSAPQLETVAVCLLDASPEVQAARLAARGGDDPALLPHHQAFAAWMRQQAIDPMHMPHVVTDGGWEEMRWDRLGRLGDWAMHTIDTSQLSRREVAAEVLNWCRRALAGSAPIIRVPSI